MNHTHTQMNTNLLIYTYIYIYIYIYTQKIFVKKWLAVNFKPHYPPKSQDQHSQTHREK